MRPLRRTHESGNAAVMDLLDRMTTFVRVVEAGSFSSAARQLRMSSAAVSRQIASLETELRLPLLRRTTRRMAVTEPGGRYYARCLRVLQEVEEASLFARADSPSGLLRVNAPVSFGLARVVPEVPAFLRAQPRMRVDLRLEDVRVNLVMQDVDVAVRVGALPDSTDLVAHPLGAFRRVLVAAPRYLKGRTLPRSPDDLPTLDLLGYASGAVADTWTLRSGNQEARVRVMPVFACSALQAVRTLALLGVGVGWLPEWLVQEDMEQRRLRRLLPEWTSVPIQVHALHRTTHRGVPRIRAWIDHLRTAYQTMRA
jgi:DNA-binding transcriptional LysR family regulator